MTPQAETTIQVSSSSFPNSGVIPLKYAFTEVAGGQNVSPHLLWSINNPDIKSFALLMYDPHPTAQNFVHWCMTNLPADTFALLEGASGAMNFPGREWSNGYSTGYEGPYPPPEDDAHPYVFKVSGVDMPNNLTPTDPLNGICTFSSFHRAIEGHVVAEGTYQGTFDR